MKSKRVSRRGLLALPPRPVVICRKRAVGGVGDARPGNAFGGHVAGLVAVDGILDEGSEEVVRGAYGVGVAGEMDVDLVLGNDAGLAAAGSTALDAEDRAQGRLAEVDHSLVSQPAESVSQADGGGGLAFSGGRGRDAGNDHQLAALAVLADGVEAHLGLGVAVGDQVVLVDAQAFGYDVDGVHLDALQ